MRARSAFSWLKTHYLILACLVLVLIICSVFISLSLRQEIYSAITPPKPKLKLEELCAQAPLPQLAIGDVILRQGVSADSAAIAQMSHSIYSHVGMVAQVAPEITVIHATTEDDLGAPHAGVVEVPLRAFVHESTAIAIVRFALTTKEQQLIQDFLRSKLGQAFHLDATADRNYCSTIVADALNQHLQLNLQPIYLEIPLLSGDYLFPQAFIDEPHGKLIYGYPSLPEQSKAQLP